MGKIQVDTYVVGMVQTNCYVVSNLETKDCIIIDPGASGQKIAERIKDAGYTPTAVLLTHGHFDHAGAAKTLSDIFSIPVYAHESEKETLADPQKNVGFLIGANESYHADIYLKDEQVIELADFSIKVIHTPGHTEGGCCYYIADEDILFSGDTLFAQSVGRTDFPGGSMSAIVRSIREKLMRLPDDTTVYPGHNDITTIDTERKYNPYL